MKTYNATVWYRYDGGNEKDFFNFSVIAENKEEALRKASDRADRYCFKIEINE